jgi:hypothetical protein
MDAEKARAAVLPPLQSVLELTTAFRPPERTAGAGAPAPAEAESSLDTELEGLESADVLSGAVGRALPDGKGRLADGTWFEKKSGVEYGQVCIWRALLPVSQRAACSARAPAKPRALTSVVGHTRLQHTHTHTHTYAPQHGFWKRWQLLKGGNEDGTLEWEETWWEASDWTGMKEMGAEKKGEGAMALCACAHVHVRSVHALGALCACDARAVGSPLTSLHPGRSLTHPLLHPGRSLTHPSRAQAATRMAPRGARSGASAWSMRARRSTAWWSARRTSGPPTPP